MILILIVTVSYLLVQFPLASSDSGFTTGFETSSPHLSNMSLVLYDTFEQASPNSTKDLNLEFFDEKNKTLIKNVSFFINATKDDNVLIHELFYTHTGLMTLQFAPGSEMGKWVVNGTSEPVLGGMMSDNDALPIQMSAFTPGTYHFHLEVLAIGYANGMVDQSHPPTFDSWWSIDDKGNISKYENSTTVSIETLSHMIKNVSPLQQVKSGATASDIVCKNGSYLAMTSYHRELVCLKAGTISKLASRGFLYGTSVGNTNYATVIISPESENQASHNSYSPGVVTVVLGVNNTVRWVNQADTANTIVPDMPLVQNGISFGSDGVIKPDQTYTFTFTEPGTFAYHTEPHPWMKGTVIVLPSIVSNTSQNTTIQNPFVADENGKVDLSKIHLPPTPNGQIDYDKIGYLVSENQFENMLKARNIQYEKSNWLLIEGPSALSYPPITGYCGYVKGNNNEERWFSSGFHYDTLTSSKISNSNPDSCTPGVSSCFCTLQTYLAENNTHELTYFTASQEDAVGNTLSKYLGKGNVVNVSNEFVVGKYNLDTTDPYLVHYCGKFTWGAQLQYFEGYIRNSNVLDFSLATEKQKLCAINSDAKLFSFDGPANGTSK